MNRQWKTEVKTYDDRRDIAIPGDYSKTLGLCVEQFVGLAGVAIRERGAFFVALSGGSTPKSLYELLSSKVHRNRVDWAKVHLFWSDERCVPPSDPTSNYRMAMDAGFASLPLKAGHIHRMPADQEDLEKGAADYEGLIEKTVPESSFDLIMLGMGDDGHTASLFPKTHGLHSDTRLVIANYIPSKEVWRMTFTFKLINQAKNIAIYILGKAKAATFQEILTNPYNPDELPIQKVGTRKHKALFIVDTDAAAKLPRFR